MKLGEFSAHYDGPALDTHEMDVTTLGPALLAFGEMVRAAHKELAPMDKHTPTVRVQEFRPGSFEVLMVIEASVVDQVVNLFTSQKANAGANLLAYGGTLLTALGGAWKIIKRKATNKAATNTDTYTTVDGDELAIKIADKLATNPKFINQYKKVVQPLDTDGIEHFAIKDTDGETIETVNEAEAQSILAYNAQTEPIIRRETCIVEIGTPQIAKPLERKWRLEHEAYGSISASLLDEDFAQEVLKGTINFHNGALFKTLLRIEETPMPDEPEPQRKFEIISIEPISYGEQTSLFEHDK
ncbi:hypothetical protein [Corynebacterium renale]|uniref:hypothetical protein n=1 Tax=Corynebacterium renale TaxID=1724 RepID=UPI0011C01B3A|nr:hypothetical protein [Corynebacterium renale]